MALFPPISSGQLSVTAFPGKNLYPEGEAIFRESRGHRRGPRALRGWVAGGPDPGDTPVLLGRDGVLSSPLAPSPLAPSPVAPSRGEQSRTGSSSPVTHLSFPLTPVGPGIGSFCPKLSGKATPSQPLRL